ncbi:MAG: damage-inducible protein DinB [Oceanospirillaceae bacterium]|nr:damage-inducible protein DinB [Oceanospirillaceae bacterium]
MDRIEDKVVSELREQTKKLLKFKSWVNQLTFTALSKIPHDELLKERQGTFKSILQTQNHIYVVDHIFQSHLTSVSHPYSKRYTDEVPTLSDLQKSQREIDEWYIEYTNILTEEELLCEINFNYVVSGKKDTMSRNDILHHLVTHNCYHNGHLRDMMYHLPFETDPLTTDYNVFLNMLKEKI